MLLKLAIMASQVQESAEVDVGRWYDHDARDDVGVAVDGGAALEDAYAGRASAICEQQVVIEQGERAR